MQILGPCAHPALDTGSGPGICIPIQPPLCSSPWQELGKGVPPDMACLGKGFCPLNLPLSAQVPLGKPPNLPLSKRENPAQQFGEGLHEKTYSQTS